MWDLRHLISAVVLPLALVALLAGALASAAPRGTDAEPDGTCGFCVLAPSGTSLTSTGNGAFTVNGANIVVNSRGAPAVKVTSNASVSAPSVGVVGGVTTTGKARVENLTTGIDPIADPLDGLPVPALMRPPDVPSVTVSGQTQRTISPGVYDEITVTGGGVLTLTPGTYVILGGFSASGTGAVSGDGVSLYLACPSYPAPCAPGTTGAWLRLTGNGTFALRAPDTDCGASIQADPGNRADIRLTGNGQDAVTGILYARSGSLVLTGNGSTFTLAAQVVVGTATVTGNGNVTIDPGPGTPCSPGVPEADAASAETREDEPVSIVLTGRTGGPTPLTFVLAQPQHGTAAFDGPASCTTAPATGGGATCSVTAIYTPHDDFFGSDAFTFTVGDGTTTSAPATVDVETTPVNDPPVAGPDSAPGAQDTPLAIATAAVLANDTPGPANESGQQLTVTAVAAGPNTHGTVTLAGGTITYVPEPGFFGSATFTYTVCDDGATAGQPDPRCADGTVTITIASAPNQAPTATPQEVTTPEDTPLPITLAGTDSDGDPLTFAIAEQPAHGSLGGAPPNVTYTPAPDYFGGDSFTFTASDGKATSAPATVTIVVTPVNDPPIAGADSASGRQDTPLQIAAALVLANDTPGPPNEAGQNLTVTAVATGPDSHGTAVLAGGTITYTPDPGYVGPATITYTVCDDGTTAGNPDPRCAQGTITITITANQAPTATPQEVTTPEDTPLPITLAGADPDGDPLTFAITQQPAHGSLGGTPPNLTYTPDQDFFGSDSFAFAASDGAEEADPATVAIDVTEVNDAPAAEPDALTVGSGLPSEIPTVLVVHNDVSGPPNESGQNRVVDAVASTPDTHGTVSVGAGKITYTPDPGYVGPASFGYTLCDDGTTNSQPDPECVSDGSVALTVAPANQTPTADDQQVTTAEDTMAALTLTGGDPDGDPLTFQIVHPPVHGFLIGVGPALTYMPAADFNGLDEFTFVTNDGLATSEPATVALTITEVNDPPVPGPDGATLGGAGTLQPPPTKPRCGETCAVIWGDPHMVTYDEGHYDFQAVGEFIATKSTTDDFELQIRTAPFHPSRVASMALAAAMRVAGHRVAIYRTLTGMDTRVDGVPFTVPSDPVPLPGGGSIGTFGTSNQIFVIWPDSSVVVASAVGLFPTSYRLTLEIGLAPARMTHVLGLLGNADGQFQNDIVTRTGVPIAYPPLFSDLYPVYADSWRILQAESLFDYGPGENTGTFTDLTFPDGPVTAAGLPPGVRAAAAAQCAAFGITQPDVLDACIVDLGVTGDPEFASSSAAAQEAVYDIPDNTGTTEIGVPTAVTIDTAGQTAVRSFAATAGQRVTLTIADNTIPEVDVVVRQPSGASVATFFISDPSAFRDTITLPVTGSYTVTVAPRNQGTGSLTFTLGPVPDDSTGQTAIDVPTTVTIGTAGQNAARTFVATAGQHVTLTVSDNTIDGVDIAVREPNGTFVNGLFVSGPSAFRDAFTLPVSGTYSITIDPRNQATGSLTFTLGSVPDDSTGQISIGVPATVTIGTPGQDAVRSFDATAGQKLTLTVTSNTIPGVSLVVRQPNGSTVTSLFVSTATGFRDTFDLPVAGTYSVLVDPSGQNVGTVTFRLDSVPDNTGTTAIGTPTSVTIGTVGENAVRTFPATAGQNLTLTVTDNTIAGVSLVVRQPNGSTVTTLFVSGPTGFRDTFGLPVTGTYSVLVDPSAQLTGSLTFRLDSVPDNAGTTAIGTPTPVTIGTVGENAVRTFPATAGQNVTLAVTGNTIPGVLLSVLQPSGSTVTSLFVSGASGFRSAFTLPVTGTYSVLVDPSGQGTGSLTFTLAAVTGLAASQNGQTAARETARTEPQSPDAVSAETASASGADTGQAALGATAAAADPVSLTLLVPALLANDRPGPANEAHQTLTLTAVRTDATSHGTATLADGAITYTPDEGYTGPATIFYTVCDDGTTNGAPDPRCSEGTIGITVTANNPPTADDKQFATAEDVPVPVVLTADDPDGDPVAFTIESPPSHGTLSGTAPNLTYTPAPDFHGEDSFTYRANDTHDESPPATVDIAVSPVNDPPAPQADSITTGVGQTVTVAATVLAGNDAPGPFDESGQALTVTAVSATPEIHGTVGLAGGIVTYTPDPGFAGTATAAYTVCDNGWTNVSPDPKCADGVLTIVINRPPTAVDVSAATSRGVAVTVELIGTDPENDPLTFAIVTPPAHGALTGTGSTRTYTPEAGFSGPDSFTFTVADAFGVSAPATASITVTETPPPVVKPDAVATTVNTPVLIDVLANDSAAVGSLDATTLAIVTPPVNGTAAVESGKIRYTPAAGVTPDDHFSYRVCDTLGVCGQAVVTVATTVPNRPPVATPDSYETSTGTTLHPAAPGILANDSDPDPGDAMQARLVRGVSNGNLLLKSNGEFTYTPHGPGIDTFVYRVLDRAGLASNEVTVTIAVSGPPGPPVAGNDLYEVQTGRELDVAAPGVLDDDFSPNPKLVLTALLQGDVGRGTLLLRPNGSFLYTPAPGFTGIDQFSYLVRDSEGRLSQVANVGITVGSGGPPTAVVTGISPPAGARITDRTPISATLAPPPGETVTSWTLSFRRPGDAALTELATGAGTAVAGDFDPTTLRNGTYAIVIRAVTSGGGVLVSETGVGVEGSYKPGRYSTTFLDVAVNSANIPIDLLRTYDSADKTAGDFGVGWRLELANFRVDTNGPLGAGGWSSYTCGSFPFLATCYTSTKPHFVTVTWPDGTLERFRFAPDQGSSLVPTLTTAGFKAEPGTTSTLAAVENGLMLSGSDFLLGNFFFADGIYDPLRYVLTDKFGTRYTLDRRGGLLSIVDRNGNRVNIGDGGIESVPASLTAGAPAGITASALNASPGLGMTFVRDAENRITRIAAPGGNIDYSYSPAGDLVGVSYPNGTSQTFTYDSDHGLLTTGGGGKVVRTLHYDAAGRVTAITDGNGNTTTLDIDVGGHQQISTDPTGRLTTVNTYDNRGNLIRQTRIAGGKSITTSATYDTVGRQLSTTDGLGHTSSKTYDAAGNVLTQTDANGRTTVFTYNAFGQPLTIKDPLGHVTTNTYDARGNLTTIVDAGGHTTTNTYDAAGNLLTSTDPVGRTTTYTYDDFGQPETMTDPGGNTTHYTVDPASGLLMSETDATGATTSYTYDAIGHLTSFTDANGHKRSAAYDALNRITSLTDHVGKSVHQVYDASDNLTSITDRNGDTITYGYDANSRLISKNVPGAGLTTFSYDPFGRLTGAVNAVAQLTFTYDDADRVLTAKSMPVVPGALPTSTFTYAYDAAGNVTSTQGPGGTTGYSYDANSQLATMTDPASGIFNFGYDATGRRTSLTRPNGITDATTYNAAGDLTSLHSTLGATLVNRADYAYNPAGLRSSFTSLSGVTSYTYDSASQLTSATPPAGSGLPNELYSYDGVGNRISSATAPVGSFDYDPGDRLLADATATYTYDSEGNLRTRTVKASGATTTYTWTAEHQLVRIDYPDSTTSTFRYDPLDRRVEIADASAVRRYAFDRQAIAAEYDTSNALAATWILPGNETLCALEMVRNGQRYFYLVDGLRSTVALVDMSGAIVASYRYEAFGTPLPDGSLENPFQWLCIYIYGIPGLGLPPSGPYSPGTSQSLTDPPLPFPGPNPFPGGGGSIPPGDDFGPGGGAGGGGPGGGKGDEGGGVQCTPNPVQIYPKGKGWKKFSKLPGKLYKKGKPKGGSPRKGGGTEYIAVLPTQETVQAVADFGEVIRCQFRAAAGALGGG